MVHITQVMIADEDSTFARLVCKALHSMDGFSVTGVYQTGIGLVEAVRREKPDILLLDLLLPGVNALTVLRDLNTLPTEQRPCIFIVSSFASAEISAECDRLGVSFFLRKPIAITALIDLMSRHSAISYQPVQRIAAKPTQYDILLRITQVLSSMKFPAHVMGYRYAREGILMTLEDSSSADCVTKILYPSIAKKFQTTWTSVERDIRNAITIAWKRSNNSFPGFSSTRRPANREFILTISDRIRYEMQLDICTEGTLTDEQILV